MRTKNLLTAIVLPSLFAACTADELVKVDNGVAEDLSKRPIVEGVTISLGDANTKAIVPEGGNFNTIQYESTDKVGALLVDQLGTYDRNDHIGSYNIMKSNFNTNYEFKNVGGASFASEAYMVEGNYVFYFPYNNQRSRTKLVTNLPATQVLAQDANGRWSTLPDVLAKSEEKGAPISLGYDFIDASDANKTVNSEMKQIYAMPEITIVNSYTENETVNGATVAVSKPIKIKSISLTYGASGNFVLSAPLKFSSANGTNTAWNESGTSAGKSIVNVLFNETIPDDKQLSNKAGVWTQGTLSDTEPRYTDDVIDASATGVEKTNKIVVELAEAVEVPADGKFTFYAVIPAADYSSNKLKVQVENEVGLSTAALEMGAAKLYQGRRYPIEEYTDGRVNTDLAGSALTAYVSEFTKMEGYRVTSVDEIINYVKTFVPAAAPVGAESNDDKLARYTLKLRVAGEGAAIDSRLAAFLNQTTTQAKKIEFVNSINFVGTGVNLKPSRLVVFDEGAVVKNGANVTLEGVNVADAVVLAATGYATTTSINVTGGSNKITVANGGTATLKAGTIREVKNNGTLNLSANTSAIINNHGVANVKKVAGGVTLSSALTNGDATNNNEAAELNIESEAALTLSVASKNAAAATINNLGTLDALATLTNNGIINNGDETNSLAKAQVKESISIANKADAKINNYADLKITTNKAEIEMASQDAKVDAGGDGTINNDMLATVVAAGSNEVTYTMQGSQTDIPTYLNANKINTLVLDGVTLTLSKPAPYTTFVGTDVNVVVKGSTSIVGTTGTGAKQVVLMDSGTSLTIAEDATLTVSAAAGISANSTDTYSIDNYGTVNNKGQVDKVSSYTERTGSEWNVNPYVIYVSVGTLSIIKAETYELTTTTSIDAVTKEAKLVASSNVTATIAQNVYANVAYTGKITVGDKVTLEIEDKDNTTDFTSITAPTDKTSVETISGLVNDIVRGVTPAKVVVDGGTLKVKKTVTFTGGTKTITYKSTDGINWTFDGIA